MIVRLAAASGVLAAATLLSGGSPAPVTHGILVSRQLFDRERLAVGEVIELAAAREGGPAAPYRIDGVYEPTPDPMQFAQVRLEARLHLDDLLSLEGGLAAPDSVSAINVALAPQVSPQGFADDVSRRIPGLVAQPTRAPNARSATFTVVERFHLAIAIVTIAGSGVFLLALMVMLVDERRETVAVLRLIGLTRGRILAQVVVEGAVIAVAGAACGIMLAAGSQPLFNRFFEWRYDTALVFLRITPGIVAASVAVAIPVGVLASAAAVWTILRRGALTRVRR